MRLSQLTTLGVTAALVACGASERPGGAKPAGSAATAPSVTSAGAEGASPDETAVGRAPITREALVTEPLPGEPTAIERDGARLSVYVRGPSPLAGTAPDEGSFEAEIVVVNTGDRPADVALARASFDAWRGDRRIECGAADLEGPASLGPGQAHTYRATGTCDLARGEEHEVRAYLELGADSGELHREVHHVGTREVLVP